MVITEKYTSERLDKLKKALLEYNVNLDEIFPYPYNGNKGIEWKDTGVFSEAANNFRKTGKYTLYQEGTPENDKFWDEEENRIHNGYQHPKHKDQWITGWHYLYLNYCPIYHKSKKKVDFPDFWDLDADYFKRLDEARLGKQIENFSKEEFIILLTLHFIAVKSRQKGFSLKDVVPLLYLFNFRPSSISYIGSFLKTHATKSWTFLKNYLNHFNKHTIWYKDRNPDTKDYVKASFKEKASNGREYEMGYLSEIFKLCFEDEPAKGVGGALDLFIYEEAGVSPSLKETIDYVLPNVTEGDETSGFIIAYGSVGDMEKCKDLEEYYFNPEKYGFYGVKNIWGSGGITGYFVPEYMCMHPHIDKQGNSLVIPALESIIRKRDIERKKSTADYNFYCSQHPISDSEAFLSRKGNMYPLIEIKKQINKELTDPVYINFGMPVELVEINGRIDKIILDKNDPKHRRYDEYPVKSGTNNVGQTWVFEIPEPNIPEYLYISSADTTDHEKAVTSDSLLSILIYKMDRGDVNTAIKNQLVASFTGRFENENEWYEKALKLMRWYSSKCLVENHNLGFINYVKQRGYSELLQKPLSEILALNPTSTVSRDFGYHPTTAVQINGDKLILKELTEVKGYVRDDEGVIIRKILGLEDIHDVGLLREIIGYDGVKNVDRFTAYRGLMLFKDALISRKLLPTDKSITSDLSNLEKYFGKSYSNNNFNRLTNFKPLKFN